MQPGPHRGEQQQATGTRPKRLPPQREVSLAAVADVVEPDQDRQEPPGGAVVDHVNMLRALVDVGVVAADPDVLECQVVGPLMWADGQVGGVGLELWDQSIEDVELRFGPVVAEVQLRHPAVVIIDPMLQMVAMLEAFDQAAAGGVAEHRWVDANQVSQFHQPSW
ncbi:MAG: hypothetical protein EBZ62_08770 [Sphingobacteriia bacterium]|nr:hypothetical protein [Sphingobacteriia bacterium]